MGPPYSAAGAEEGDFASLGIDERIRNPMEKRGITRPSRQQHAAIQAMLNRENVVLQSKSGTGKTLSFCIALVQMMQQRCCAEKKGAATGDADELQDAQTGREHEAESDVKSETKAIPAKGEIEFSPEGEDKTTAVDPLEGTLPTTSRVEEGDPAVGEQEDGAIAKTNGQRENEGEANAGNRPDVEAGQTENKNVGATHTDADIPPAETDTTQRMEDASETQENNTMEEVTFGNAVVIAPTRELAVQINRTLTELAEEIPDVKTALTVGGADMKKDVGGFMNMAPQILVATPGRLINVIKFVKRLAKASATHSKVLYWDTHIVVLDEADMLIDDHFMDQTRRICKRLVNPFVQVVATSATFVKYQFKLYEDLLNDLDEDFYKRLLPTLSKIGKGDFDILKSAFSYHVYSALKKLVEKGDFTSFGATDEQYKEANELEERYYDVEFVEMEDSCDSDVAVQTHDNGEPTSDHPNESKYRLHHTLKSIVDFLKEFMRETKQMIVSASHVNRVELPAKGVICFTENDCLQDVQSVKEAIEEGEQDVVDKFDSPVLKNVVFCYTKVPEAPNIVKQVSLKLHVAIEVLKQAQYRKCIIFSNESHTRMLTANTLERLGLSCTVSSSRQSTDTRQQVVENAEKNDRNVVIAADLMSRGIHIDDVDLIINMDLPSSKEAFLHRSGRTGRFGKPGICVCICSDPEMDTLRYLEYSLNFECSHIEDVLHVDKGDEASPEKREDEADPQQIANPTANVVSGIAKAAETGGSVQSKCSPRQKPTSVSTKNAPGVSSKHEVTADNKEFYTPHQRIEDTLRDTLVASIHSKVFPGLMEYVIPAFSILAKHDVYLEGAELASARSEDHGHLSGPTSENAFRIKFVEYHTARVILHVSSDLYQAIAACDKGEEFSESLYHIIAIQENGSAISILDPVHRIFRTVEGPLLITVVGCRDALELISGLLTMLNVEFVVHETRRKDKHVVSFSYIASNLSNCRGNAATTAGRAMIVDLFRERFAEECSQDMLLCTDVMVTHFIRETGASFPAAFTLAYQAVTQELYATGADMGTDGATNRRARNLILRHPFDVHAHNT
ncbi:DEAD/DEAH box helicase domain containing protein, putative [Babesia bigemina]|uniref:DEAD/DEAH box helicase domain containing protein, putative n=1 Tax=Babesia bigemina TaxID=5866 RepID=A0A061DCE5_BABBI|nr:DEAD/DEAH box helicase domain containing protein, putative [Babesia bigemina]CDR96664.1 DEAD/DEAH box helicase domain containing protein, putative [Babesia bigemina]|eukprot:XP_012768850.1 DEAD/DEAH box helicase domain containing protein, putative [Babesia bigemina]